MQVYPILLIAVVIAADAGMTAFAADRWPWAVSATAALGPIAVIIAAGAGLSGAGLRRARRRPALMSAALERADRIARGMRALVMVNHALAVFVFGWVTTVRRAVGDQILIDELIVIAPAVLGLLGSWWVFHPAERMIREALLVPRLDQGLPIYPLPSRWRYVLLQGRLQLAIMLVPVLLIAGLAETANLVMIAATGGHPTATAAAMAQAAALLAALLVFLLSPLLARVVLEVNPLPDGPLRDSLMGVCRRHRVGVRHLLVWNTSGMMINAAVMGVVAPLRCVLLTDALLESVSRSELEAVMAHEIGHVRRHHLPWMVLCLLSALSLAWVVIEGPGALAAALHAPVVVAAGGAARGHLISEAAQLALGLMVFGWVSRRFERQADTFAVQHLSGLASAARPAAWISRPAVDAMQGALGAIARLNAIRPDRASWRHGSIAWRQAYLETLVGRPMDALPIDRQVRWIKLAALLVVAAAVVLSLADSRLEAHGGESSGFVAGVGPETTQP